MKKSGQIELSFGMIFAIIIIIATIAVSFYIITKFLDFGKCADAQLFFNDVSKRTDEAWRADSIRDTLTEKIPSGASYVCFGNLSQSGLTADDTKKRNELVSDRAPRANNLFLYPFGKACDTSTKKIEHVKINSFFCVKVDNGQIKVRIEKKDASEIFATISKIA